MTPTTKQYRPFSAPARSPSNPGLDDIPGLAQALSHALTPLTLELRNRAYWDSGLAPSPTEYLPRDGFIPYAHNRGGMERSLHVPSCEQYDWSFLEFGSCDECAELLDKHTVGGDCPQCGYKGQECASESDGYLNAFVRIWLKFEGQASDGRLSFYLVMSGGNADAPYYREKYLPTLFEASFSCKSVAGFQRAASPRVRKLLALISPSRKAVRS